MATRHFPIKENCPNAAHVWKVLLLGWVAQSSIFVILSSLGLLVLVLCLSHGCHIVTSHMHIRFLVVSDFSPEFYIQVSHGKIWCACDNVTWDINVISKRLGPLVLSTSSLTANLLTSAKFVKPNTVFGCTRFLFITRCSTTNRGWPKE